jgi:hypothetical protein
MRIRAICSASRERRPRPPGFCRGGNAHGIDIRPPASPCRSGQRPSTLLASQGRGYLLPANFGAATRRKRGAGTLVASLFTALTLIRAVPFGCGTTIGAATPDRMPSRRAASADSPEAWLSRRCGPGDPCARRPPRPGAAQGSSGAPPPAPRGAPTGCSPSGSGSWRSRGWSIVPTTPMQVRYALTPVGAELIAALQPLVEWGVRHRRHP